jgi:uncharacterized protein (DUF362 family)
MSDFSRRNFFHLAGAGALVGAASGGFRLNAQQQYPPAVPATPIFPYADRAPVSLVKGDNRRKNVLDALVAVDREVRPAMARKKYVLIKVNNVNTDKQLAATHVDALRGILDYVAPRFKGPVVIAEASSGDTLVGFDHYKYAEVIPEYKRLNIKLVDLNREQKYEVFTIVDANIRPTPVRLAKQLQDPDAFIISAAMLKTHDSVVATGSVKNMVMGSPIHNPPSEPKRWSDKILMHAGTIGKFNPHAMNYNLATVAKHIRPSWGVGVIDGYEGMEGDGPVGGTPISMQVALASPDFLAGDRVALEVMGIPAYAVGYLQYAAELGVGQFDLAKIDIRGEKPESVKKTFKLHKSVDYQLQWLGDQAKSAT